MLWFNIFSLNSYFDWLGHPEYKVKNIKIQKDVFANPKKELTKEEYERLLKTAYEGGKSRLYYVMQIAADGYECDYYKKSWKEVTWKISGVSHHPCQLEVYTYVGIGASDNLYSPQSSADEHSEAFA